MIDLLEARGATGIRRMAHPGAWSIEFTLAGEKHCHAFIGGVDALSAITDILRDSTSRGR